MPKGKEYCMSINCYLDPETYRDLFQKSCDWNKSCSEIIRQALSEFLERKSEDFDVFFKENKLCKDKIN